MGRLDRYDILFANFSMMFPNDAERAVSLYGIGRDEIVVTLDDGARIVWNDFTQSARYLHSPENRTEESDEVAWRKYFGRRLQQALFHRGSMTQQEFADAIGVTRAMLSRYLNGHSMPSYFIIQKMARVLGCPISELTEFPEFE